MANAQPIKREKASGEGNARLGELGVLALPLCLAPRTWAAVSPDRTALVDSARSVTYAQLNSEIEAMARLLGELGVKDGDRVVAVLPNCVELPVLLFACMRLNVNLIPLDMLLTSEDVAERVKRIQPAAAFASWESHLKAAARTGAKVLAVGDAGGGFPTLADALCDAEAGAGAKEGSELGCGSPSSPALTIFTSGSTGKPKGVMLSQGNLAHAIASIQESVRATCDDVFITALPFSHIYGINSGILLPVAVGGMSVIVSKFKPEAMLDAMERHRVTLINGVPSMYRRLAAEQLEHPRNLPAMRSGTIAGAQCANLEDYERILHCALRILYGSTESPIVAITCPDDSLDVEETGVGKFLDSVRAAIVDDEGRPASLGQPGEIVCQSPGTMVGYLGDPQATAVCVDSDGWMHTGDVAYQDERGYVHVVGRKTDIINRGGYKVSPAEVEAAYEGHPDMAACCVMGMPHTELGQQIVMFAELAPGKGSAVGSAHEGASGQTEASPATSSADGAAEVLPDAEEARALRDYAIGRIAKFKIPDQVIVVRSMPYLANGKVDKAALRAWFDADAQVFHNDAERRQRSAPS